MLPLDNTFKINHIVNHAYGVVAVILKDNIGRYQNLARIQLDSQ